MKISKTGHFYGDTNEIIHLNGVTLTDTEYSQDRVPWHYHENNYFTFILQGGMTEGNRRHVYECLTGDLLFHNWQDAHYNIASGRFTRGFHLEINDQWFDSFGIINNITEGSIKVSNPRVKTLMYTILKEMKLSGQSSQPGIDALLLEAFGHLGKMSSTADKKKPKWVDRLKEMLGEAKDTRDWPLTDLAASLGVHPVHLSREFSKHFGTTLGDYIRTQKVQHALTLLPDSRHSLTDIAFECGFADQSHFIRSFKSLYQVTPLLYRKLLVRR